MASMDRWAPKLNEVRNPKDANKKNGMFWNFPRYLYFGGAMRGVGLDQSGSKAVSAAPANGQNANGPISSRGKGK